jgi:hypothetical protein
MDAAANSGVLAEPAHRLEPTGAEPEATAAPTVINLPLRILILCAAAFLLAWMPRLRWGFWTDEAGTFWMVCQGWRAAIGRTAIWPGQSIPYSILESFFVAAGFWKEPLLRIPSVLASVVAAWQLKRLAELTINRRAGWLAIIPLICAPDMVNFGTSARPYALALAASIASFRYLLEWRESPDRKTAVKYLIASALTLHFHYVFGFIFVIQAVFIAGCRWFGGRISGRPIVGRTIGMGLPLAAVILLPASMLPLVGVLRSSANHAGGFAHPVPPTLIQLLQICFPPALLLTTGLGLLLLLISAKNPRWRPAPLQPELVLLLATWATVAPVIFFLAARLTGQSIFASRYLLFTLPAAVLFIVWIISGFEKQEWRFLILLAIFAGTVLHPGSLLLAFRESASSWREPLRLVESLSQGQQPPVFVASGIVESGALHWTEADPASSRLFAALTAYSIRNRAIPLPYRFDDQVKTFIRDSHLENYKTGERCFLLATADSELGTWMSNYIEQIGFRAETHPVNDFVVIEFRHD